MYVYLLKRILHHLLWNALNKSALAQESQTLESSYYWIWMKSFYYLKSRVLGTHCHLPFFNSNVKEIRKCINVIWREKINSRNIDKKLFFSCIVTITTLALGLVNETKKEN